MAIALPDRSKPDVAVATPWRARLARPAVRAFGWRLVAAALFVVLLVRLIAAHPLPHGGPALRLSLSGLPASAVPAGGADPAAPPDLPRPFALLALPPDLARAANAVVPVQPFTEVAPPFRAPAMAADARARAADCLAAAIWYEAGDNPPGERAVAQVVLNRVRHPAFPKSVCAVVFQDADHASACQFTFACDGSLVLRQPGAVAWARARAIALAALSGAVDPDVGLATHYHADYVVPQWRDSLIKLGSVGAHLFYRWPGYWGTLSALHPLPPGSSEPQVPRLARLSQAHMASPAFPALPEDDAVTQPAARRVAAATAIARTAGPGDHLTMALDPAAFPGSYAVRAFALCKDHPHCLVLGQTADAVAGFLYLQDTRKGVQTALWNCARTPRADTAQCLPDSAGVAHLIAGW
jgi:spore germination cell wall hydrolase CwlJ-like protein